MDEYDEINLSNVQLEYETQRQKLNAPTDPNLAGTPAKRLGCLAVCVKVFVGLLLLKLITEFFSFFQ